MHVFLILGGLGILWYFVEKEFTRSKEASYREGFQDGVNDAHDPYDRENIPPFNRDSPIGQMLARRNRGK